MNQIKIALGSILAALAVFTAMFTVSSAMFATNDADGKEVVETTVTPTTTIGNPIIGTGFPRPSMTPTPSPTTPPTMTPFPTSGNVYCTMDCGYVNVEVCATDNPDLCTMVNAYACNTLVGNECVYIPTALDVCGTLPRKVI